MPYGTITSTENTFGTVNGALSGTVAGTLTGSVGVPGPQGPAGTIEVGTVTASAPGGAADVVNVGTDTAAILDFTIPRGEQGTQGIQGIQGIPGEKGDKGDKGDPGVGVPAGGSAGQVLAKVDGVDYNTEWINPTAPDFISSVSSPLAVTDGNLTVDLSAYAPLASPVFTGDARAVTPATADNDTSIATTAFVKAQGYLTSAPVTSVAGRTGAITLAVADVSGAAPLASPVFTGDARAVTPALGDNDTSIATTAFVKGQSYLTASALTPYAPLAGASFTGDVSFGSAFARLFLPLASPDAGFALQGQIYHDGTGNFYVSPYDGVISSLVFSSTLANYAVKSGDTFTGKVNFTPVAGAAGLNIGIGGVNTTATTPGDMWIATGGTILNYRDGTGAWRQILTTNNVGNITVTSSTLPPLRLTQQGTGPSFIVEDSTTPDTSALVVDSNGNVGIGVASGYTATSKVEVVGNVKADTFSNGAGPAFSVNSVTTHTGGSDSNDIIVTIGGVNYRIGARLA